MEILVARSFSIKNFGCRATQADGAGIAAGLARRGLRRVGNHSDSDVVVINTCTVTAEADRGARKAIRRTHRENPDAQILVTGCYAQRSPEELSRIAGVKWVVGNSHKHEIADILGPPLVQIANSGPPTVPYHGGVRDGGSLVGDIAAHDSLHSLPTGDALGRSRPNVKVQDGCDNRCSFCIIPSVRGRSRSASADAVVAEVRSLQARYPEVVLTGINMGRWGRDFDGRPRFGQLLRRLIDETAVERIRLSSVEPMDWSEDLIRLVATSPRIAKHVHMPLQSGSDAVLRRMRRRYRVRHYAGRLELVREAMPTAAIGADVMVGFPGESDDEFDQTRSFVERMPFTYLHVFSFSARHGTDAAEMGDQVPKAVKRQRNRVLRELIARKNLEFRKRLVGTRVSAVTLGTGSGTARALSDNFIDLELRDPVDGVGVLVTVRIEAIDGPRTIGRLAA